MNNMEYFILKDKTVIPVDLMTWATWFENGSYRRIAKTELKKGFVSTVFMGIDHNLSDSKEKLLFETMAFDTGTEYDGDPYRYSTYEEAEKGHTKIVEEITKLL